MHENRATISSVDALVESIASRQNTATTEASAVFHAFTKTIQPKLTDRSLL